MAATKGYGEATGEVRSVTTLQTVLRNAFPGSVAMALWMLVQCTDLSVSPEISISSLPRRLYVAYTSPDRIEKPDTLALTFTYSSSVDGPVAVHLTMDSGATWTALDEIGLSDSGTDTFTWVPKTADSAIIRYFGKKSAWLQLSDTRSGITVVSDTFRIIGALPVAVEPLENDTFAASDTILIAYGQNVDISGFFTVLFKSEPMTDWVTAVTGTEQVRRDLPFRFYETKLVPDDYREEVNEKALKLGYQLAKEKHTGALMHPEH